MMVFLAMKKSYFERANTIVPILRVTVSRFDKENIARSSSALQP